MPSNSFIMASATLLSVASAALLGTGTAVAITNSAGSTIGSAVPTGKYPITSANSTTSASATATASASPNADKLFCPLLNGAVFTDAKGHSYEIGCDVTYFGNFIDVDITVNQTSKVKRAAATGIADCIAVCDDLSGCVGTSFDKDDSVCSYYSSVGAKYDAAGFDFALVVPNPVAAVTVVPSGSPMTSAVLSTITETISSCAASITNCPYDSGAVVTGVVVAYTTVCPCTESAGCTVAASATGAAASGTNAAGASALKAASGAVTVGTATVYSSTVISGTTTVVPIATAAVAIPVGSATTNGVASSATVVEQASSTTAGVTAFTGAADSVKAGMGMAAVVAIAALAL